jgi:hypothetical protein
VGSWVQSEQKTRSSERLQTKIADCSYHNSAKPKSRNSKTMPSQTEKRLFRTRNKCPKALQDKLGRAMRETMTMIRIPKPIGSSQLSEILADDRCHPCEDSELALAFNMAGSTGNIYTVTLDYRPTCTCPDFEKREDVCKHIMYTLVKVVGLPKTSTSVYQKALLTTELAEIHSSLSYTKKPAKMSEKTSTKTYPRCNECQTSIKHKSQRVICPSSHCGGVYHESCLGIMPSFGSMSLSNTKPQITTTLVECPCCGVTFHHDQGYENIAHVTGQSRHRDHSTYRPCPGYPGYRY